jgi:hypothetical protein
MLGLVAASMHIFRRSSSVSFRREDELLVALVGVASEAVEIAETGVCIGTAGKIGV